MCSFGTMDWYCILPEGHEGPHESVTLKPIQQCSVGVPHPSHDFCRGIPFPKHEAPR
jgi:hypothetical protein